MSRFPVDGGTLDLLDKRLSAPLFRLQLGLVGEAILSIPGCFYGMPAFHVLSPTLIACALGGCSAASDESVATLAAASALLVVFWFYAQSSPARLNRVFLLYLPPTLVASPIVGLWLVHWVAAADSSAQAAAAFHLLAWFASTTAVISIKHAARRRRPLACDPSHIGHDVTRAVEGKALSNICTMLRSADPNAAFPSMDVAGSVAFAYPLWRCASYASPSSQLAQHAVALRVLAVASVALSATGRMYWQAHHLFDVTCGGLLAVLTCVVLDLSLGSFVPSLTADSHVEALTPWWHPFVRADSHVGAASCVATTPWWHPFVALLMLLIFAKLSGADKATPSRIPKSGKKA